MPENHWSDDELRTFLTDIRSGGFFGSGARVDDDARVRFRAEAMRRIVPAVQRRVLAEVGATLDARGVAAVTFEVLEDSSWGAEHVWLMVSESPWDYLAELVAREIRKAYRKAVQPSGDAKALKGIEKVSAGRAGGADAEGA